MYHEWSQGFWFSTVPWDSKAMGNFDVALGQVEGKP